MVKFYVVPVSTSLFQLVTFLGIIIAVLHVKGNFHMYNDIGKAKKDYERGMLEYDAGGLVMLKNVVR